MDQFLVLADDDSDDAELFQYVLKKVSKDLLFKHVENGQLLLAYLASCERLPDMVFLDVNMPIMDGFQCLEHMRGVEAYSQVKIYMYSTSSHPKDRVLAAQLGADDFIVKPYDLAELQDVLQKIVKQQ